MLQVASGCIRLQARNRREAFFAPREVTWAAVTCLIRRHRPSSRHNKSEAAAQPLVVTTRARHTQALQKHTYLITQGHRQPHRHCTTQHNTQHSVLHNGFREQAQHAGGGPDQGKIRQNWVRSAGEDTADTGSASRMPPSTSTGPLRRPRSSSRRTRPTLDRQCRRTSMWRRRVARRSGGSGRRS